ncbi:MAG TPA: hypothetical protein VKY31_10435 [Terriglobia bacterium]|nr:hypothetical protein [Terriglobia bacterium]
MNRAGFLAAGLAAVLILPASQGFSQVQTAQNRIPQQIVINGLTVNAASAVTSGGQVQSYTCSSPQHYTTLDGRSQGWACYEETTGVWLMNAIPPAQAAAPAPAPVRQQPAPQAPTPVYQQAPAPVYQQAPPTVIYQQPPVVVYQQAPPTVIYQQPAPTVVYTQPARPVVLAPAYPSSVILGAAAINAAGRIASAAIVGSHYPRVYYYPRGRRW